jgi:hypothetical protein
MNDDCQNIPLCQTEFLQDISIELGRRFTPSRHPWRSFSAEVQMCEHEGEQVERLALWASAYYGTWANLTLWEDRRVWVGVALSPAENNEEYRVGFYPQCAGFAPERIAEAFRDTVSVSTRLCYGESPLQTLRRVWNHSGEVETSGALNATRKG